MPPPPPLLSRDPGALRLITFPDTTWPSAAARRSASRRLNRPQPTPRSGPGLRRKPRRGRRRAGEADGRSGFRWSPQRRSRRRERRGEREAEAGEATSLPGQRATRDAGAQEDEDSEEAVAAAPHAHTATASPPPGSARRAAAAARHAGSEGRCRRPWSLDMGRGTGGEGRGHCSPTMEGAWLETRAGSPTRGGADAPIAWKERAGLSGGGVCNEPGDGRGEAGRRDLIERCKSYGNLAVRARLRSRSRKGWGFGDWARTA